MPSPTADNPFGVDTNPDESPDTDTPDADKPEDKQPTVADMQVKLEQQRAEAAERVTAEIKARDEFWAKRQGPPTAANRAAVREPDPEPDPVEAIKWLDLFSDEKDPAVIDRRIAKAIDSKIKQEIKRGDLVSRAEVDERAQQLVTDLLSLSQLQSDFPELSDKAFATAVGAEVQRLSDDPDYEKLPAQKLQRLAAQSVKLQMISEGKLKPSNQRETEDERRERIERQRGGSGGRTGEPETVELNADERYLIQRWGDNFGVDEKTFKQHKREMEVGPGLAGAKGGWYGR